MDAAEILRRARALVERGWTQGEYARRSDGTPTLSWTASAAQWCAVGAMNCVLTGNSEDGDATSLLRRVVGRDLELWNDATGRTQQQVIEAFDRAIALAEAA